MYHTTTPEPIFTPEQALRLRAFDYASMSMNQVQYDPYATPFQLRPQPDEGDTFRATLHRAKAIEEFLLNGTLPSEGTRD
jgi:hypothetical protein